ncbi:hypothetical protein [Peribacillus frigoritolerans]|uniref:hypothetical protein n=1 Tax=Peribacillus frigoritolerans TaxID=450367 RepID=UPI0020BF604C|nr:hypothetical protein [Peribacillus frigoritolerans]
MAKQQFERGKAYISEKEDSKTVSFVINAYQDTNDLEKIWLVSKDVISQIEINNHEGSVNHHSKAFERLSGLLKKEGKWRE